MSERPPPEFFLDEWLIQPELNTFRCGDRTIRVEPKVMELCVRLAQNPGRVVTKAELLESVWPDAIVGDDSLTRAMSELRRALDDNAREGRLITTIPKRGYRLAARVTRPSEASPRPVTAPSNSHSQAIVAVSIAALGTAVALIVLSLRGGVAGTLQDPAPERRLPVLVSVSADDGQTSSELPGLLHHILEQAMLGDRDVSIVAAPRVADVLQRMRRVPGTTLTLGAAMEVAERDGEIAGLVVGRVGPAPGGLALTLQVADMASSRVVQTIAVRAPDETRLIEETVGALAPVADAVNEFQPRIGSRLLPVTTTSLAALRLFSQAVARVESVSTSLAAPWPEVVGLFEKALALDPEFASARAWLALALKLAESQRLSAFGGEWQSVERLHLEARAALKLSVAVPDPERLFIQGMVHALLEEREQAVAALEGVLLGYQGFFEVRTRLLLHELYAAEGRAAESFDQIRRVADLRPEDFEASATAAQWLMTIGESSLATRYVNRARAARPRNADRDVTCWLVAWLDQLPSYERWAAGDLGGVVKEQTIHLISLDAKAGAERDAQATFSGYFWLALGRVAQARVAFERGGHTSQREWNLAQMADLLDDRSRMTFHLRRHGWAYNPVPYARAGMFAEATGIMRQPSVGVNVAPRAAVAEAEHALANGQFEKAIARLSPAIDRLRDRPSPEFYNASISLARAWKALGEPGQAVRVLEEATSQKPFYTAPGLGSAWWIKAQVSLVHAYRGVGSTDAASRLEHEVRRLLAMADADHPFLRWLDQPDVTRAVTVP